MLRYVTLRNVTLMHELFEDFYHQSPLVEDQSLSSVHFLE